LPFDVRTAVSPIEELKLKVGSRYLRLLTVRTAVSPIEELKQIDFIRGLEAYSGQNSG